MLHHVAEHSPCKNYENDIINPIWKHVDSRKIPECTKNMNEISRFMDVCMFISYVHICTWGCTPRIQNRLWRSFFYHSLHIPSKQDLYLTLALGFSRVHCKPISPSDIMHPPSRILCTCTDPRNVHVWNAKFLTRVLSTYIWTPVHKITQWALSTTEPSLHP